MSNNDAYEKLADMLCTEGFRTGPGMKTPEFLEILRLQYTPEEARLAVQVGVSGAKVIEIIERTGIEMRRLEKMLHAMAEKGTIWIDPESEDPTYRALGVEGPGIVETAAWVEEEFPWTEELKKRWNTFKYVWVKEGITPAGPVVPAWAAISALPPDALPSESIVEVIKQMDYWSVSTCPCRSIQRVGETGISCSHMLETCMMFGDFARWAVKHGHAREITCEEAIEILDECENDGLVHAGLPDYGILCNCCRDACANMIGMKLGLPHVILPSPFVAVCGEETCSACMACADRCPVDAVQIDEHAVVDASTCIGCGVCVVQCDTESMRLVRREKAESVEI